MRVSSSCIYCGVGCRLIFEVADKEIKNILPDPSDPVSQGHPCLKGLTIKEVVRERLGLPQIRIKKKLRSVSWEEALGFIFENTKNLAPQEVFFSGSGRITNEDNFVVQKFARIVFKSNSIDNCCSRLCHQPTVQAMNECFGTPNLTLINNLNKIDTLFVIGSNPASNYPAFWTRVVEEKQKRPLRVILVGSMFSLTSKTLQKVDHIMVIEQGSEQVLLNGIIRFVLDKGKFLKKTKKIEGFERLQTTSRRFTPEFVAQTCRVSKEKFIALAKEIANSQSLGVFHGMGITQHPNGIENLRSFLNLVILKNAFILTLRGEINVQGAGDMLCNPLPLNKAFPGVSLPTQKGKNMIEAFYLAPVKAAFISSFNPAQSLPDLKRLWKNLSKMFLVIITPYFNKTCEFAQVVLPSPILIERKGTITNGERRVRLVRPVLPPFAQAKPEWQIYQTLARLWHQEKHFDWREEKEIFEEICRIVPDYQNLDVKKVFAGKDGWPIKKERFRRFFPQAWEGYDSPRSKKYPFILTTFRRPFSFLTSEDTEKSTTLQKANGRKWGFHLNPKDAKDLKIKDGNLIEVESTTGKLKGKGFVDKDIPQGTIAASFHSQKLLVNLLFPLQFDEETFTPNFKATAVKIRRA